MGVQISKGGEGELEETAKINKPGHVYLFIWHSTVCPSVLLIPATSTCSDIAMTKLFAQNQSSNNAIFKFVFL